MFNERSTEMGLPVWQSPKYKESKKAALDIIEKYEDITEGDFWILMNKTKNKDKMIYSGLIISHNGCLKLNDVQPDEKKFRPECVSVDKEGFGESLVYTYNSPGQGIYEVGEVSKTNCKNDYPYAMAFKRCFDRVVLKITKIAYAGIYSDSEADEFRQPVTDDLPDDPVPINDGQVKTLENMIRVTDSDEAAFLKYYKVKAIKDMDTHQFAEAVQKLRRKAGMDD